MHRVSERLNDEIKGNDGDIRETLKETEVFKSIGWKDYYDSAVDKGLVKEDDSMEGIVLIIFMVFVMWCLS